MKIVFFGTPDFVIPVLEILHKTYNRGPERELIAVVTQPPKQSGREKMIMRSPVDNWAYKHKIPLIFDPQEIPEADLGVIAAYGAILPESVIKKFSKGILNIHPSLLPKFRGASPIQATIVANEQPGLTVIKMDKLMDHGPIISSFKDELLETDTNESLRIRLFERSAQFLIDLIPNYLAGKISLKEQNHNNATYTKLTKKEDGFIPSKILDSAMLGKESKTEWPISFIKDYSLTPNAEGADRFIRALNPWPGAWTNITVGGQKLRLKILKAHVEENKLVLDDVQLEGKNAVSWTQFQEGYSDYKL